jgi:GNAT superfamily N-acetyltransferase
MSLYTFSQNDLMPSLNPLKGLRFEESTDITLLSKMSGASEEEIVKRLANDHIAFIAFLYDTPAAFGWMARGKARIGELGHDLILPIGNRYLWNFRTLPSFRGNNIYPLLMQYILSFESKKAERFWIIHAPENKASLKGIRKAGFRYAGKLYLSSKGEVTLEPDEISPEENQVIKSMGFRLSDEDGASCWGCNSPYIKNKPLSCCCTETGEVCSTL